MYKKNASFHFFFSPLLVFTIEKKNILCKVQEKKSYLYDQK